MPKQTRWAIKQKLDTVLRELTKAEDNLVEIAVLFKEQHPDYYEGFCSIVVMIDKTKTAVDVTKDSI